MKFDWDEKPLSDLITIKHGFAFKGEHFSEEPTSYVLTTPGNFAAGGGFRVGKKKFYSGPVPLPYKLTAGDLLVTMTDLSKQADTLGYPGLVPIGLPEAYLHNQRVGLVELKPGAIVSKHWLYYLMCTSAYRGWVVNSATGTTVKHTSPSRIGQFVARVPTPLIQDKTVQILNPLDSEIAVLHAENTALESIAQALFRSWFVDFDPVHAKLAGNEPEAMSAELAALFPSELEDSELGFIPKGWCLGRVGDIGQNPRTQGKPTEIPATTPYVGLEHMPRRSLSMTEWGRAATVESGKFWFTPSDILFGKLRPYFHKVGIANMKGVCSTDILVIRANEPNWHAFLVMHLFSKAFIEHATQLSDGARMPRTNWRDTAAYKFALPPADLAARFNKIAQPMFALMAANIDAIRSLASLRDHLLPRLISGKLRLEDAEASVAAITSELEAELA
jgi:type I restriction enzyme S subunit